MQWQGGAWPGPRSYSIPPNVIPGGGGKGLSSEEKGFWLRKRGGGNLLVLFVFMGIFACELLSLLHTFVINTVVPIVHFLISLLFPVNFSCLNP